MSVITLTQLQDAFFDVTESILGVDPKLIRHAYQTNSQPFTQIEQDSTYIHITETPDEYSNYTDIYFDRDDVVEADVQIAYTRVIQVQWTLYGPNSFDNANKLRQLIKLATYRDALRVNNIFPLLRGDPPTRLPYSFNNQNWERSDLKVKFNVFNVDSTVVEFLSGAVIEIHDKDGLQRTVDLPAQY